jgi:hypothetical protein
VAVIGQQWGECPLELLFVVAPFSNQGQPRRSPKRNQSCDKQTQPRVLQQDKVVFFVHEVIRHVAVAAVCDRRKIQLALIERRYSSNRKI